MQKTALITGASSGIGKEFAKIHVQNGGNLVIVARRIEKLKALKVELEKEYSCSVFVIQKDLTLENAAEEVYKTVQQQNISIDYLINNAGFGGRGKFHERNWKDDLSMIQLNIIALTALTRLFLPDFVERNYGRILNISSTASLMAGPLQAVYFATKAYVTSFSNAIAEELHDTNVTVTALLPGATKTEFGKVAGMNNTKLFEHTFNAYDVAKDGYNGMLKGKLDVWSGLSFSQKIMLSAIPFAPKKIALSKVRKGQELK